MQTHPFPAMLCAATLATGLSCSASIPRGQPGKPAEALANQMLRSVDTAAWKRTGAVAWTFADRNHHIWDRTRHFAEVRWADHRVIIDINGRRGLAWRSNAPLRGDALRAALDEAHGKWINDSFWLNPVAKAFDPGTHRERVAFDDGTEALLVQYVTGGRTPGDAYLWLLDANGRPKAWRMWVSILPIGGVRASWEGWIRLATGAWVSTLHETAIFDIELTHVRGAPSLGELVPNDPFAPLQGCSHPTTTHCGRF